MKKIVITGGIGYIGTELCKIYSGISWNNEILVMHHIGKFPDGTKEAIMAVHTLSNGKIVKTESGATRID